jgi:ribosomal protein S7
MPRRAEVQARTPDADAVYGSALVTQVINKVMLDGKKSIAEQIVYTALESVGTKTGRPPVEVLEQAVKTVTPVLEVRSRRVGGANYQVPVEVPRSALARHVRARASREGHAGQARQRDSRRAEPARRRVQAKGRRLPDGAGEQGLRALPLVDGRGRKT